MKAAKATTLASLIVILAGNGGGSVAWDPCLPGMPPEDCPYDIPIGAGGLPVPFGGDIDSIVFFGTATSGADQNGMQFRSQEECMRFLAILEEFMNDPSNNVGGNYFSEYSSQYDAAGANDTLYVYNGTNTSPGGFPTAGNTMYYTCIDGYLIVSNATNMG